MDSKIRSVDARNPKFSGLGNMRASQRCPVLQAHATDWRRTLCHSVVGLLKIGFAPNFQQEESGLKRENKHSAER